jgi:glutathione synthase
MHTRMLSRAERDTWVSMWSLDKDDGKGAEEAVHRVHKLVLKPQRDGGGNNVYRGNIPLFVVQMPQQERVAWVAMELICPPRSVGAYLVWSGTGRVSVRVMNELAIGMFGWALFGEGREVREE